MSSAAPRHYESRRETASHASDRDLRDAAEMHRRIYQAIKAHDPETARQAMYTHLVQASAHQAQEAATALIPAASTRIRARRRAVSR